LPVDKLSEIFTLPTIKGAVQELTCGPDDRIQLVETIYKNGKRLFAMLIYNGWQDRIIDFRKHRILDSELPLSEESAQEITGRAIGHRLAVEVQWMFLPYVFPEGMWECHLQVDRRVILPFVRDEQIGTGAFGDVDKISVLPCQQNFTDKGVSAFNLILVTQSLCRTVLTHTALTSRR
jgi:hypothetical protein